MDRRIASLLLVTGTLLGSATALAPTPAAAAVLTASPNSFANTVTSQSVSFPVGTTNATLYSLGGGADVVLTGPGSGTDTYEDASPAISGGTVTATLNLVTAGLPAGPGTYAVSIFAKSTKALGVPLDTSSVTVTATSPTISALAGLAPGTTAPITITADTGKFAKGDQVSITPGTGSGGVTITGVAVGPTTITGTLHAASDAGHGKYNVVVTDTAGNHASCANCVSVDVGPAEVTELKAIKITTHSATLTWTPPTGSVTGYQIVVSTSSTATSTGSGITVTHTGTSATATVTGLKSGTKYYMTVTATNGNGPGVPNQKTFFTSEPSFLTLSHTAARLPYGGVLTLSGNLSTTGDAPLALQPISLYSKVGSQTSKLLKTVKTTADGNYDYSFKPKHNATYVAFYPGAKGTTSSPAIEPVRSKSFGGTVGQRINLVGTPKHHGLWLLLSGKVAPNASGRTVVIYRKVHHHLKKYATAKVSARSTYKLLLKHLKSGRYVLFAAIKATALNTAGKSQKLTVTRP
jgi:hypothetical protein